MEFVKWDAKVKEAMDSFVWDRVEKRSVANNTSDSYSGLLYQVGCDYESILLDMFPPEASRNEKTVSNPCPSDDNRKQPRFSNLSIAQHNQYLTYFELFKNVAGFSRSQTSINQKPPFVGYMNLHRKVFQEQQEYVEYAYQMAVNQVSLYDRVLPEAEKVFKQIIAIEMKRLQQYVNAYVYHQSFLISVVPYTTDPQPRYENHCVTLGKPPVMIVPDVDIKVPVYSHNQANVKTLNSITEDENAEKLAKLWNADIVLSIGALHTLANNAPPFNNEWEMPMSIKQVEVSEDNKKNVMFIDKALPPKSVNGREKMFRYFKKAVKHFIFTNSLPPEDAGIEESIPQVDGTDDKIKEKSSPLKKRSLRLKSLPASTSRGANVSVWKDSFNKIPSIGTRSKSITSSDSFPKWTSSKGCIDKDRSSRAKKAHDSEEDALIIDTASEEESKTLDSPLDEDPVDEDQQISFKATDIPSNIIESVLNDELESGSLANEQSTANSSSKESSPTTGTLRETSLADASPAKESIEQPETPLRRSSRRLSISSSAPHQPEPRKTRSKSKNVRQECDANEDNNEKKDLGTKSARKGRKRSTKGTDLSADEPSTKLLKATILPELSDDKAKDVSSEDTVTSPEKVESRKSKRIRERKNSKDIKVSLEKVSQTEANISSMEESQQTDSKLNKEPLAANGAFLLSKVAVKTPKNSKPSSKTKKIKLPSQDSAKIVETESVSCEKTEEDNGDILGRILSMQTSRTDKTGPQEAGDAVKKSSHLHKTKIVPDVPPPVEGIDFDSMLQLHSTRLIDPGKSVFYNLWTIGSHRVLIRGCMHGKLQMKGTNNPDYLNATIRTKLEYQPDLGCERLSQYEACAEWLDLHFRPQPAAVLRCRVNPFTSKIIRCERVKNTDSTYQDFEGAGFNHLKANKLLLSVFQKLSVKRVYDEGSYLICHKHGANEFTIRKAALSPNNKLVIYDLLREYANPGRTVLCTAQTIPWNPLDPWRQTVWQYNNRRIPMTFDIKPRGSETGKKKKGKKSKKQTEETN